MKILHTADIHLGELVGPIKDGENARMLDTIKCMGYIERKALKEDVDVILIAGDLFNKSKLWADEMLKEITIASGWLKSLCSIAPTILMFGTANHDNVKAFENIKKMNIPYLTVVTEPELLNIKTKSGDIQVAAVPGVDKGYFRTLFPGMDMEDENKAISEALGNVILGISADADPTLPLVLMTHYTVIGCSLENGESIFLNSDIVIPTAALASSNYDLVCLGHIHKAQSIPNCLRPVYYSGPPNAITFNEEGQDKGFWVHEILTDSHVDSVDNVDSRFIKTPSREFLTLEWTENDVKTFITHGIYGVDEKKLGAVENKIVRVIYSCDAETNKQFSRKSLEKALYEVGAFYISEIRPARILATVDKDAMSENDSVESNLRLWLEKQEIGPEDISNVIETAKPMITQVSASLPTGKLTGVFEPLRLEVKNYRSYLEEEFDFTKVSFATVNGPNGIGKSSFFMDAIADCLYEEPREGELTGWISNGENIKSGAMTFEFLMGADKWRVIRTRVKSGKSTLALQKWHEDKWEDHSGDRKDQTQEKILNLLGMDALTFKSCALIMQDNYGVFLEADKTERMQVLSNILGLGIYDKLHDLAKDELRNRNRKIEKLKAEIIDLDEKLLDKKTHEVALQEALENKKILKETLIQQEKQLEDVKVRLEKLKDINAKTLALTEKITTITNEIEFKETEKKKFDADKERAQNIVDKEEIILKKIDEYESTKERITILKAKAPLLNEKNRELKDIKLERDRLSADKYKKDNEITELKSKLAHREELKIAVGELEPLEESLTVMDKTEVELSQLKNQRMEISQKLTAVSNEYDRFIAKTSLELGNCRKKAELIENSMCPVNNPTCNFLRDAIEAKNKITELELAVNSYDESEIISLKNQLASLEMEISNINYFSSLHREVKDRVGVLRKKKEELLALNGQEQLLENLLEQLIELDKKIENLCTRESELTPELYTLHEDIKEIDSLESSMQTLEKWYKGKDELPAAKQLLASVSERLEAIALEISKANLEIVTFEKDRDKLYEDKKKISVTEIDLSINENKVKNSNNELTSIEVAIGVAQSKIDELETLEINRIKIVEAIKNEVVVANMLTLLTKAFSIDGIPFQIVRSVVSELSSQSNEILSQMTGGKMAIEMKTEKVLKNKNEVNALEIWISDYQRGTMPYLSRSGGQKVKAALSVAFALADLKANRAGIQLGMMFIDEPPFLDGEGVQAYCDALELMHNRYPNMRVVAISHDPTMKARFPQEIEVMDAGDKGSKILFN
jgi:exonuclease SbcD